METESTPGTSHESDEKEKLNSNNTEPNLEGDDKEKDNKAFECNICLDTAKDAVISMCGHLFCWPCLHRWLETKPNQQMCPVCKAAISKERVIPLYGRGSNERQDPRDKVPPRPAGQRSEPEANTAFPYFGLGDGNFHMSFGIGAFPFAYFSSSLNFGEPRPSSSTRGTTQYDEEMFLSKAFLWVAFIFIFWLLIA